MNSKQPTAGVSARAHRESDASNASNGSDLTALDHVNSSSELRPRLGRIRTQDSTASYRVYKRRWFGLAILILLNIIVSWCWIALAPVSANAAEYFETTESIINWLSTAFLFAFVVASPLSYYALLKHGPKTSIVIAAALLIVGNWIKYGGTRANVFGVVMLGQILIGIAQPFVLAAPTTYSDLWFTEKGRTTATAVASLSNPFGAAIGQLVAPFWVTSSRDIPNAILYTGIIATVLSIPAFFIPGKPPTPPAPTTIALTESSEVDFKTIQHELKTMLGSVEFYLIFIPFAVYVGFFNAFSSLLNQILEPYGFSEDDAGIAGAILIVVGLVAAAIVSPLVDKYKFYKAFTKAAVPMCAIMYLILIWAPGTRSLPFVYVVCALQGAASFGLVPVVLEYLVEMLYPLGPSVSSTVCWAAGQLLGGIFIVIMDALKASDTARPPLNMHKALVFQGAVAMLVMPLPLCLGLFGRKEQTRLKRRDAESREWDAPEPQED